MLRAERARRDIKRSRTELFGVDEVKKTATRRDARLRVRTRGGVRRREANRAPASRGRAAGAWR